VVAWLDAKKPLDHNRPVAVVAVFNDQPEQGTIDDVVLLAPIKPGAKLDDDAIRLLVAPGGVLQNKGDRQKNYAIIPLFVHGEFPAFKLGERPLQEIVTPSLAKQLNVADVLVFVNPQKLGRSNDQKFVRLRERAAAWPEVRLRALGLRMVEDLSNVEHTFFTLDLSDGLKSQFSILFRNPDKTPPFIFDRLKNAPSKHAPHYRGLPGGRVLGAVAIGDAATRNAELLTVLNRLDYIQLQHFMNEVFDFRTDDETASNLIEFLVSASKKTDGVRAALYLDNTLAIIVDTPKPDEVIASIRELLADESLGKMFEYVPNSLEIAGVQVDTTVVRRKKDLPANASPTAKAIAKIVKNGLLIAKVGEHVVITSEPAPNLMEAAIANIKADKPGLAAPDRIEGQTDLVDVRFHASQVVRHFWSMVAPGRHVTPDADAEFSRMRIQATTQEITIEVAISQAEFLKSLKAAWEENRR
jgi:hypothetical protein